MANEWIKMRGSLLDHPKVIAICRHLLDNPAFREWLTPGGASPLNGDILGHAPSRYVTVGALLKLWSVARARGKFDGSDLVLQHSALADLDEMAGAPGIGEAMKAVGWVVEKNGVTLPNFIAYTVPMTDAERQRKHRERTSRAVTRPSRKSNAAAVTSPSQNRYQMESKNIYTPPTPPRGGEECPAKSRMEEAVDVVFYPSGVIEQHRKRRDEAVAGFVKLGVEPEQIKPAHAAMCEAFSPGKCTARALLRNWDQFYKAKSTPQAAPELSLADEHFLAWRRQHGPALGHVSDDEAFYLWLHVEGAAGAFSAQDLERRKSEYASCWRKFGPIVQPGLPTELQKALRKLEEAKPRPAKTEAPRPERAKREPDLLVAMG